MILFNGETILKNRIELNSFIMELEGEIYDDDSEKVVNVVIEYMTDVWEKNEQLTIMVHKKISEEITPIANIDISETADLTKIRIDAVSKDDSFKMSKTQKRKFDNLVNSYFKSVKPLFDRLYDLNLD